MTLLNIEHKQQQQRSDCLVACTQMVLNYLQIDIDRNHLHELLEVTESFGLLSNLQNLSRLGLFVQNEEYGDAEVLERYLNIGLPIIAGVKTLSWTHWNGRVTDHAVTIVGIDRDANLIWIHDPALPEGPLEMPLIEFEIGWYEKESQYAVIALTELE